MFPKQEHYFNIKQSPDELVDAPANCPVDTVAYITLLFALNPEKVIVSLEVMPVAAAIAPEELTWN